ncbi:hypothetical protein ACIBKZ_06435 [Streptomyces sp. NPDC050421]|uniref:hypothetical protein n=1 Tax=Streptomyces sp. NPDC050421 TaxID=3365613 RepID=UPI00378C70C7
MTAETPGTAGTPQSTEDAPRQAGRGTGQRFGAPFRAAALAVFPLGLLAAAMWIGRLVRPGGDDWCFLPVLRDDGVAGMIGKFYLHDNGRIANALMVAAYGAYGVAGHQWYAAASGLLILTAVWALVVAALPLRLRTAAHRSRRPAGQSPAGRPQIRRRPDGCGGAAVRGDLCGVRPSP